MSPVLEKINKSSLTAVSLLIGRQGLPKTVIEHPHKLLSYNLLKDLICSWENSGRSIVLL